MKKSNVIIFVLLALASAFFLWLWFFLGLNRIDEPLDLVLSIVWWAVIAVAVGVIIKMERTRRRRIRTVYVGDGAAFNSEKGLVKLEGAAPMRETIAGILQSLKYDFERADFPEKDEFEVKYFVRTEEFEAEERKDEASDIDADTTAADQPAAAVPRTEQRTWKGEVFIVETKEERPFDTPEELASILTSLELEQAA